MNVKNTYAAPTDKQVSFATSLASRKGFKYLSEAEKACFGKCRVGGMSRQHISELIDWLAAK
tara:strand:+ start:941 stop:1126 length:186 start_codon:yes stop_codon:yes gene_type:complete